MSSTLTEIRKVLFAQGLHFLSALHNPRAVVVVAALEGGAVPRDPARRWGTNNSHCCLGCVFHRESQTFPWHEP